MKIKRKLKRKKNVKYCECGCGREVRQKKLVIECYGGIIDIAILIYGKQIIIIVRFSSMPQKNGLLIKIELKK